MWDILLVGAGGFLGAQARYGLSNFASHKFGIAFPYGTYLINLSGSFILGLFLGLVSRNFLADESYHWLIAIGFCGGYTTFSTFTYETLTLIREGKPVAGLVSNLLGSYLFGLLAALLGFWLGSGF
jgi:fluoride exporter